MGSNCCKGDASRPIRSSSSIYSRYLNLAISIAQEFHGVPWVLRLTPCLSRAGASVGDRFTSSEDAGGVRLTVSAARAGDSGVYTLQATNAAGKDTARVRLEVSADEAPTGDDPPTFLRRLQDLTVKVGTRTRFLVEIVSSTECKVTWYCNERRLMEAERVSLVRDGTFWCADIATVSVDDTGRWTCTAENAGGRASCSAHLNVLVPKAYKRPEFVEELRALLTEQGTVSLECKVVGVPTPVLRWFKDSREIKAGDVFALTANAEDPTSLGTYTCEAVNCMGRAYSSSKVHVVGRSREGSARPISSGVTPESPPIFTKELEDKFVRVCESLTLSCHIVVPPWPRSVVWYNKEGKVEPGERYHAVEDGVGGYLLEVPSAEWPDEGEWKCVATSSGGRVGISSCYVSMEVPKNYRKPRFMENLQAVLTEEGLVSFECKVVGFPTPVLSWFKDGQELKPGDVYQLTGTNSLGSYCCIARNCMGQASSSAELTVEDIQNQLNEEEKAHLFSKNQAPKFVQGLKSVEAKIDEPFRFTIKVAIPPEPSVQWYRDEQPVDESTRCQLGKEDRGGFYLDIQSLEFLDQAEWKCVALNDYGHSVTSCFLKLIIPRHYKKPRFLENLQAILSDEGAVNLECKVIGVPQPVLKWYKDGEELKPGDIHRIISGQDGTCCLGTYTCEAQNCMGIAASSASLLGFDDSMKAKTKKAEEQALQRNLSLSTIHEERTSQMYDTPVGDITLDDKGEISFSFDGKEVSVSLYETPDLTEEEALQIVEMYADQLSENVTEHNVVELPPLRFVKETSTSGNLLMEAIIIDVSPEYFASPEEDLRTEADVEDISIADEMGPPQLSLDQDIGGEDYLEKTMALLSDEKADIPKKISRKKSDSQRSVDDFYSLSLDPSLSEDKRDDDTQNISESFASAKSLGKPKSKSSKPSHEDGHESSDITKTILLKDELQKQAEPTTVETPVVKPKRERRSSRSSRRSSSGSEKSFCKSKEELVKTQTAVEPAPLKPPMADDEFKTKMTSISTSLSKVINDVQIIERDIILKSELMSSAATASRSLEIISSLIKPLSEIHSIADAAKESAFESREVSSTLFSNLPQPLKVLQQSLTIIEKCIDVESDNKTLVKKTCVAFIENCGEEVKKLLNDFSSITDKSYLITEPKTLSEINLLINDMHNVIRFSVDTIKTRNLLSEASEIKTEETTVETKHLRDTQKAIFELKSPLNSLLCIVDTADSDKIADVNKITSSEVILNDMSASIQDLQAALEQIESLSVKESTTSLHKYNTEIIETVMESILKLRGSFEQLPTETKNEEDDQLLKQALVSIKNNLSEISSHIETIEKSVGSFDILHSDNKLEVLQKMAQILISLENNLPRLEHMAEVKTHMDIFHKNLTRVLENVIESNEAPKYFTLMEICDAVNRLNSSLKIMDSDNVLSLASLSNTLRIIQDTFVKHVFESELNCSILTNISEVLLCIQEALNHAEEVSLQLESEAAQNIVSLEYDASKANVVVEHIDHTIAIINTVKSLETTEELKNILTPVLENICPVLEDLKRNIASMKPPHILEDEHVSEISDVSFVNTLANPLLELNNNLLVLNHVIVDNIESLKENTEVITAIAEPLHELQTTLQILQQDVISQYGENVAPYDVSINIASAVQNLQSCMVMIQEQPGIEGVDEMSTLEDISGIKTTAEPLPSDRLVLPTADEIAIEHSVAFLDQEVVPSATAQALQTLNQHITILQNPEVVDALDTLSEISDYSSLKSVALGLGELYTGIEEILHPLVIENSNDIANLINTSKLAAIAEPMQELHQSLSVLDTSNIPVYEHILEIPTEKFYSVIESISDFKQYLGKCIQALFPAMETAEKTIEISNRVEALREVCENLKSIIKTTKAISNETHVKQEVVTLEETVDNLLDATDVSKGIQIQQVKNITEELFEKVITVQEELLQYTPHTPEKLAEEAKLIQAIDDIENNIAVLEQYDFVDLSRASEITSCTTPQLAIELESEPLVQMDDILQNAVNVLQDSAKETPLADLMILEDFFKTCKSEFTIIRLIISKSLSHKKIIRLIQEFTFLQNIIKDFKLKRSELQLSHDIDGYLKIFFLEADGNLKTIQESLLKLVNSQSELLFTAPINTLHEVSKGLVETADSNENLKDVVIKFVNIFDAAEPMLQNIEDLIKDEIKHPTARFSQADNISFIEKMDAILKYTEDQLASSSMDKQTKEVISKLASCLLTHQDYKDATGTGKMLIILKCLSESALILQAGIAKENLQKTEKVKSKLEDNALKMVLTEMLEPLHALHSQLVNIQEQVTSGVEEKSVSVDISTTESMIEAVSEIHREIVQQMESAKLKVDNEDKSLIKEADEEIHAIKESLKSLDNIPAIQELQEIAKPIQEIEKSLHGIMSFEIVKVASAEKLSTDINSNIDSLDNAIERFLNIQSELLAAPKLFDNIDINKCIQLATKIRKFSMITSQKSENPEQINMTSNKLMLLTILSKLDCLNTEKYVDEKTTLEIEKIKSIFLTIYQLLAELNLFKDTVLQTNEAKQKEMTPELIDHIDDYIKLIETVEEISAVDTNELHESVNIARELRDSILISESEETVQKHEHLIQRLQNTISTLHNQALNSTQELPSELKPELLKSFVKTSAELKNHLVAVTEVQTVKVTPMELTSDGTEVRKEHPLETNAVESSVMAESMKPVIIDYVPELQCEDSSAIQATESVTSLGETSAVEAKDSKFGDDKKMQLRENVVLVADPEPAEIVDSNKQVRSQEVLEVTHEAAVIDDIKSHESAVAIINVEKKVETKDSEFGDDKKIQVRENVVLVADQEPAEIVDSNKQVGSQEVLEVTLEAAVIDDIKPHESAIAIINVEKKVETKDSEFGDDKKMQVRENVVLVADQEPALIVDSNKQVRSQEVLEVTLEAAVINDIKPHESAVAIINVEKKDEVAKVNSTEIIKHCIEEIISVDMNETLDNLATVINTEELEQTVKIAKRLQENITFIEKNTTEALNIELETKQTELVQQLQSALLTVQEQIFDNYQKLETICDTDKLQQVADITVSLQTNLASVVTVADKAVESVIPNMSVPESAAQSAASQIADSVTLGELLTLDETAKQQATLNVGQSEEISMGIATEMICHDDKDIMKDIEIVSANAADSTSSEMKEEVMSTTMSSVADKIITPTNLLESSVEVVEKPQEKHHSAVNAETLPVVSESVIASTSITTDEMQDLQTTEADLTKSKRETLIQNIETYISRDIAEIVNAISDFVNLDDLKQSLRIANELRENIAALQICVEKKEIISLEDNESELCLQNANLTQQLFNALTILQTQLYDNESEFITILGEDILPKVKGIVSELKMNLNCMLTSRPVVIQQALAPITEACNKIKLKSESETQTNLETRVLSFDPQLPQFQLESDCTKVIKENTLPLADLIDQNKKMEELKEAKNNESILTDGELVHQQSINVSKLVSEQTASKLVVNERDLLLNLEKSINTVETVEMKQPVSQKEIIDISGTFVMEQTTVSKVIADSEIFELIAVDNDIREQNSIKDDKPSVLQLPVAESATKPQATEINKSEINESVVPKQISEIITLEIGPAKELTVTEQSSDKLMIDEQAVGKDQIFKQNCEQIPQLTMDDHKSAIAVIKPFIVEQSSPFTEIVTQSEPNLDQLLIGIEDAQTVVVTSTANIFGPINEVVVVSKLTESTELSTSIQSCSEPNKAVLVEEITLSEHGIEKPIQPIVTEPVNSEIKSTNFNVEVEDNVDVKEQTEKCFEQVNPFVAQNNITVIETNFEQNRDKESEVISDHEREEFLLDIQNGHEKGIKNFVVHQANINEEVSEGINASELIILEHPTENTIEMNVAQSNDVLTEVFVDLRENVEDGVLQTTLDVEINAENFRAEAFKQEQSYEELKEVPDIIEHAIREPHEGNESTYLSAIEAVVLQKEVNEKEKSLLLQEAKEKIVEQESLTVTELSSTVKNDFLNAIGTEHTVTDFKTAKLELIQALEPLMTEQDFNENETTVIKPIQLLDFKHTSNIINSEAVEDISIQTTKHTEDKTEIDKSIEMEEPNVKAGKPLMEVKQSEKHEDADINKSEAIQQLTATTFSEKHVDIVKKQLESSKLLQNIEVLISEEAVTAIDELALLTDITALKDTFEIAKELCESLATVTNHEASLEETSLLILEAQTQQVELKEKLNEALTTLQTITFNATQEVTSVFPVEKLEKISQAVVQLQECIKVASVSELQTFETQFTESTKEDSMKQLEGLLQEVTDKIDLSSSDRVPEDTEALRDSLDEVQTVIIKLKRDFDGANDTLNETLEDLECSVRSVQLQINEDSPPELLKEACATLQLLVNNMSETSTTCVSESTIKEINLKDALSKCSEETSETVKLLEKTSLVDPQGQSKLVEIILNLSNITETMKSLKSGFIGHTDTLIEKGIDIMQSLDQIEEKVFSIEKELEAVDVLPCNVRETIVTAVHSVYGSISNMRSTVSSTQRQYMFENYGKPSENFLHSIKHISSLTKVPEDESEKAKWRKFSKSLRNVLNHFEDIKFYINLDKTARLPSDAAFTKIILEDLKSNIKVLSTTEGLDGEFKNKINKTLSCVDANLRKIEERSTLEVKEKIPIFKDIAFGILEVTSNLKVALENRQIKEKEFSITQVVKEQQEIIENIDKTADSLESEIGKSEIIPITGKNAKDQIEKILEDVQTVDTTQQIEEMALATSSDKVQRQDSKVQKLDTIVIEEIENSIVEKDRLTPDVTVITPKVEEQEKVLADNGELVPVKDKHNIPESMQQLQNIQEIEVEAGPSTRPDVVSENKQVTTIGDEVISIEDLQNVSEVIRLEEFKAIEKDKQKSTDTDELPSSSKQISEIIKRTKEELDLEKQENQMLDVQSMERDRRKDEEPATTVFQEEKNLPICLTSTEEKNVTEKQIEADVRQEESVIKVVKEKTDSEIDLKTIEHQLESDTSKLEATKAGIDNIKAGASSNDLKKIQIQKKEQPDEVILAKDEENITKETGDSNMFVDNLQEKKEYEIDQQKERESQETEAKRLKKEAEKSEALKVLLDSENIEQVEAEEVIALGKEESKEKEVKKERDLQDFQARQTEKQNLETVIEQKVKSNAEQRIIKEKDGYDIDTTDAKDALKEELSKELEKDKSAAEEKKSTENESQEHIKKHKEQATEVQCEANQNVQIKVEKKENDVFQKGEETPVAEQLDEETHSTDVEEFKKLHLMEFETNQRHEKELVEKHVRKEQEKDYEKLQLEEELLKEEEEGEMREFSEKEKKEEELNIQKEKKLEEMRIKEEQEKEAQILQLKDQTKQKELLKADKEEKKQEIAEKQKEEEIKVKKQKELEDEHFKEEQEKEAELLQLEEQKTQQELMKAAKEREKKELTETQKEEQVKKEKELKEERVKEEREKEAEELQLEEQKKQQELLKAEEERKKKEMAEKQNEEEIKDKKEKELEEMLFKEEQQKETERLQLEEQKKQELMKAAEEGKNIELAEKQKEGEIMIQKEKELEEKRVREEQEKETERLQHEEQKNQELLKAEEERKKKELAEKQKEDEVKIKKEKELEEKRVKEELEKEAERLQLEEQKKQELLKAEEERNKKELAEKQKEEEMKMKKEKEQEEKRVNEEQLKEAKSLELEEQKKQEILKSEEERKKLAEIQEEEEIMIKKERELEENCVREEQEKEAERLQHEEQKNQQDLLKEEEEGEKKELAEKQKEDEVKIKKENELDEKRVKEEQQKEAERLQLEEQKTQQELMKAEEERAKKELADTQKEEQAKKEKELKEERVKKEREKEAEELQLEEQTKEQELLKAEEERKKEKLAVKQKEDEIKIKKEKELDEKRVKEEQQKETERLHLEEQKNQELLKAEEERKKKVLAEKQEEDEVKIKKEKELEEKRVKEEQQKETERLQLEEQKNQELLKAEEERKKKDLAEKQKEDEVKIKKEKELKEKRVKEEQQKETERLQLEEQKKQELLKAEEERKKKEEDVKKEKEREEKRVKEEQEKEAERLRLEEQKKQQELLKAEKKRKKKELAEKQKKEEIKKEKELEEMRLKEEQEKEAERLRLEEQKKQQELLKAEEERKIQEMAEKQKEEELNIKKEKELEKKRVEEEQQKEADRLQLEEQKKQELLKAEQEQKKKEFAAKQKEEETRKEKELEEKRVKEEQEKETERLRLEEQNKQQELLKAEKKRKKKELAEKQKEGEIKKEKELEEMRLKEEQEKEAERLRFEEQKKQQELLKAEEERKKQELAEKQKEEERKKEKEQEEKRVKEEQLKETKRLELEEQKKQEILKADEERKKKELAEKQKVDELKKKKEKNLEEKRVKEEQGKEAERLQLEEQKKQQELLNAEEEQKKKILAEKQKEEELKREKELEEKRVREEQEGEEMRLIKEKEDEKRKQDELAIQKVKEEAEKLSKEKAEKKRIKRVKENKERIGMEKKEAKKSATEEKQEFEVKRTLDESEHCKLQQLQIVNIDAEIEKVNNKIEDSKKKKEKLDYEDLETQKKLSKADNDEIKPEDFKKSAKRKEHLSKADSDLSYSRDVKIESIHKDQIISEVSSIKLLDETMTKKNTYNEEKFSRKLGNDMKTDKDRSSKSFTTSDTSPHYIKEYHYEPNVRPKYEDREKPRFIDHNHRDYTMEFARPSAYREKTIEVDNISFEKNSGRGHIYRANELVMDAKLRASAPPRAIAHESSRSSEPLERRPEIKNRSKALSEARSILSEKRSSASRDIKRKPVFSTFLTDRTAVEGSRVKLTCSVLSSSDPKVTWYKNGVLLDNKLKYRTKIIDGLITMEVLNAVPSDSAEYSCTVENENGSINTSANLKVYPSFEASPIPPTFTRSIRDTFHLAENELVLECRIRGQPLPTITWFKDDRPVSMNERFQAYYLADGVCRLAISSPTPEDSGKYICKAENSVWSDQITHVVNFTGNESRLSPNLATIERSRFNRQALESRRPHFGNVLTDYKVTTGGTIGLQVEIKGAPTRVEWLREGRSVMETYNNARTYVEQELYTLALTDVTERETGMYTCRAWSNHGTVDMNAAITVVQPNELEGKPAIIAGRPEKDVLISVGEDLNISFRVQGEPKPKVIFMKGIRDITNSQRVCKMSSDDYVKFTVKRSVISDAGTYCILARNAYGCDRAFVTVVIRQRASSENLISDWTYPMDDSALTLIERKYKSVPERIPGEPSVVDGGSNWVSIAWPKPDPRDTAPVLAYKVENWLAGKEGGARWTELGITPLNSFDAFNLKQGEEYHFRVTPRNRYGWGESVQTSSPVGVGLAGDRPEFIDILPGQLKVLIGETANLSCSVKGKPIPEVVWMKNGHELEDEDARVMTSFNGFNCSLTIKGINADDEARYSCEATNAHGRASTYARLAVVTDRLIWEADAKLKRERSADVAGDYPPQFTMRLRDRRVQATYPVRLTCQVVGSPSPSVTWFKDGEDVILDRRHTKSQDEHFYTLEIAPTTLEDGGVYEVMARNSCGAVSCHCNLVVDKGIRAYVAPEFCCGLEPLYRLQEGDELRISAVVEAYPTVGVTWYRDGVRLRPSRRAIMTLDRDGQIELALAFVTPRDAGVYTCTASNEVGRATTSGKVEVIGDASVVKKKTPPMLISPDVPYSKEPIFIRKPRSSEAREGDTVIIQCEVVGDPKPDVYWLRDFLKPDYYRDATHFKRIGNGPEYRFEIPHAKLDYTGAYSVVARNVYGEAKAIISLQILAKDPSSTEEHNIRYGRVDVIPRFERELTDLLCYDGDAIEFECSVSGHPEPDIRWFHYSELIRENSDFEWSLEDGTARLKIKQVTAEDEGTYLCEASNNLGKTTSSACLVVYPPGEPNTLSQRLRRPPALLSAASTPRSTPRSTPARSVSRTPGPDPRRLCSPSRQMPPKFYTYPFNKVVEEGDHVVFQCAVKGLPAPWATWDKDGVIITPSSRITIKEKDEILRILEIEEVTIEDVGVYRITLENDFGRVEASARLEVITQKGKFYAGVRSYSASPRKSLTYRRRPSRQD